MKLIYSLVLSLFSFTVFAQYPVKLDFHDGWEPDERYHEPLPGGDLTMLELTEFVLVTDTVENISMQASGYVIKRYGVNGKTTVVGRAPAFYNNDTVWAITSYKHFKGKYYCMALTARHGAALFRISKQGLVLIQDWPAIKKGCSVSEARNTERAFLDLTVAMNNLYINAPTGYAIQSNGYHYYETELYEWDGVKPSVSRVNLRTNSRWNVGEGISSSEYLVVRRYITGAMSSSSTYCYAITKKDTFRIPASPRTVEFIKSNVSLDKIYVNYSPGAALLNSFDLITGREQKILAQNDTFSGFREYDLSPKDQMYCKYRNPKTNSWSWALCDLKNDTLPELIDVNLLNDAQYNSLGQWADDHWWATNGDVVHKLNERGLKVDELTHPDLSETGGFVFHVGSSLMVSFIDSIGVRKISSFPSGGKTVSYPLELISDWRGPFVHRFANGVLCRDKDKRVFLMRGDPGVHVTVYEDVNHNGVFDFGELGIPNMNVWFGGDMVTTDVWGTAFQPPKGKPTSDLDVRLSVDTATWKLSPNNYSRFTIKKDSIFGLRTFSIGLIGKYAFDAKFIESRSRCGSKKRIQVHFRNTSQSTMKVHLSVKIDTLNPVESFPHQFKKVNDNLYKASIQMGEGTVLNESFYTKVNDSAGLVIRNNMKTSIEFFDGKTRKEKFINKSTIRCAYDPNDKASTSIGVSKDSFLLKADTSALEYLIRFQNVGNDTAYNVEIVDQLSEHLDVSSFKYLAGSHESSITITDGRELKFDFRNIMLPDSGANQVGSNGFVSFSIKPRLGLVHRTSITNKAGIYFDFNDPVVTNTTKDIWVHDMPVDAPQFTSTTLKDDITIQLDYKAEDPFTKEIEIYRSINDTLDYHLVSSESNTSTQWLDKSPREDATFYYKLRAINGVEKSDWSETKSLVYKKSGINNPRLQDIIKVYPNPAQNQLNVQINMEQIGQMMLLDMNGKQILQQTVSGNTVLDVSHLPKGPYMLKVSVDGNQMEKMISLQ